MQSDQTYRTTVKIFFLRVCRILAAPAALLILCSPSSSAHESDYITASGCSISTLGYLNELAQEYERRTGVKVFVRGGGSVIGIEDLRSGKVDFAAACRARQAGDPRDIVFIQVAWDALAFIVHPSTPRDNITLNEIREIYSGTISDWKQLGGPAGPLKVFVSRSKSGLSGVEASLRGLVLDGREPVETPEMRMVASSALVEQMVEETPGGFGATGVTSARKRQVKILKVNGVAPTRQAIVRNLYPLKRPLFLLIPRNPRPEVRRFVDFTLSSEGQSFLRKINMISLRDVR